MTDELKQWEYDKGYEKGKKDGAIAELEHLKADIRFRGFYDERIEDLIDSYIEELKGETDKEKQNDR